MARLTYAASGVDRSARRKAKNFSVLEKLLGTGALKTPYNTLCPDGKGGYFVLTVDGVGTKILVAELAAKAEFHRGIGVDAVAMVANDCIRCGARPVALADVIDIHHSEPRLLENLLKGIAAGAREAGAVVVGGETADVPSMVSGLGDNPYNLNMACYGAVERYQVIRGDRIRPGDAVIGLRSSGIHSNGLSLVRRALFKKWGGKYREWDRVDGLDKPLAEEVLTPTRIYAKPVLEAMKRFDVRGAVHVTGDAYAKFKSLARASGVGFGFNNFSPQPIFSAIQDAGRVSDREMFSTFNMGWGFALVVPKAEARELAGFLGKKGVEAEEIGAAAKSRGVVVEFGSRKFKVA
ncbi:MAG: phosphoribosylformylglycinamidine cyclo-ligase [Candidatus Micrarchaeota archaeon]|nr:phosphoribosylformylglycinamidine cyclo-ligase [Candidatus Micrarchaeota archaeon]